MLRLVRLNFAFFLVTALYICATPSDAKGARLDVEDLVVFYNNATPDAAKGRIEFNLRYRSVNQSLSYDLFTAQVMVSRVLMGDSATFTLDSLATQKTAAIGSDYWIPNAPTGFEVASTQNGEFRFRDRTLPSSPIKPVSGNILAHYVIHFQVGSSGFGEYQIHAGTAVANFFSFFAVNRFPNTITPLSFMLVPEPASGLLVLFAGALALTRKRRR